MSLLLAGYQFKGPEPLADFKDTDIDNGIYGIFFLKNPEKQKANYGVLYIANVEEIKAAQGFPENHKKYEQWAQEAKSPANLYIGFCPTPGLVPQKRDSIIKHLIYRYNPACNK
ncbi:MAG: hypothetical protein JXR81_07725 [Candidatus Goldbacteria bacterium]|nr:hypothetical protein [Candidatus Goldiibacteriota bacterium]